MKTGGGAGAFGWVWRHVRAERFYRDSAWLTAALLTVNASNYVLNVAVSRILGRERFGEVAAILALLYVLNVPTSAIQTLLTREVAQLEGSTGAGPVYASVRRLVWRWAAVAVVATLALAPLVVAFLRLDSYLPALVLAPVVGLALLVPLYRGVLQGRRHFALLTANVGTEAGVRLVGAVLATLAGFQAAGVMGAFGVALLASLILGRFTTARDLETQPRQPPRAGMGHLAELVPVVAGLGMITASFNVDVILARHFLSPALGGEYAAVSLAARVLFYLTSSVGGVVVASQMPPLPRARLKLLGQGLAVVLGSAVLGEAVFIGASHALVAAVFGSQYAEAAPVLPIMGAGMVALAASNLLVYFLLAMRRNAFVWVQAVGLLLEAALVTWRHATLDDIAVAFTVASVAVAAGMAVVAGIAIRSPGRIPVPAVEHESP